MAIAFYVEITLVPKTKTPTPAQQRAFERLAVLKEKHLVLQSEYNELAASP